MSEGGQEGRYRRREGGGRCAGRHDDAMLLKVMMDDAAVDDVMMPMIGLRNVTLLSRRQTDTYTGRKTSMKVLR